MIVEFDKSFEKSLEKLKDPSLLPKVERIIHTLEKTDSILHLKILPNSLDIKYTTE